MDGWMNCLQEPRLFIGPWQEQTVSGFESFQLRSLYRQFNDPNDWLDLTNQSQSVSSSRDIMNLIFSHVHHCLWQQLDLQFILSSEETIGLWCTHARAWNLFNQRDVLVETKKVYHLLRYAERKKYTFYPQKIKGMSQYSLQVEHVCMASLINNRLVLFSKIWFSS